MISTTPRSRKRTSLPVADDPRWARILLPTVLSLAYGEPAERPASRQPGERVGPRRAPNKRRHAPRRRGIQCAAAIDRTTPASAMLDRPPARAMTAECVKRESSKLSVLTTEEPTN